MDLGAPASISNVHVKWGAGYGKDYDVQVSNDASTWSTVATQPNGAGGIDNISFSATNARYVRLNGRASSGSYDVRELEVYASAQATPTTPYVPDAIDLERIPFATTSGDARTRFADGNMSAGAGDKLDANAVGDHVTYRLDVNQRTYNIRVGVKKQSSRGVFQLQLNGFDFGPQQDLYASADTYVELDLGDRTFSTTGGVDFRFKVVGKNAGSSGYTLGLDYVRLIPRDILAEAESLLVLAASDPHSTFSDGNMSGGAGHKLDANAVGDAVTYEVYLPAAGTYSIRVGAKKQSSRGIYQLSIGGADQGTAQDHYAASDQYVEFDLGTKTFNTSGAKEFRFRVTGKSASSSGHTLGLDYVKLIPSN